jgi:hypothetical protein
MDWKILNFCDSIFDDIREDPSLNAYITEIRHYKEKVKYSLRLSGPFFILPGVNRKTLSTSSYSPLLLMVVSNMCCASSEVPFHSNEALFKR